MKTEIELCAECARRKKEDAPPEKTKKEEEFWNNVTMALRKAELCRFFTHHILDGLDGQRTCSLKVMAGCGHEVLKYGFCDDWRDGKECPDWEK